MKFQIIATCFSCASFSGQVPSSPVILAPSGSLKGRPTVFRSGRPRGEGRRAGQPLGEGGVPCGCRRAGASAEQRASPARASHRLVSLCSRVEAEDWDLELKPESTGGRLSSAKDQGTMATNGVPEDTDISEVVQRRGGGEGLRADLEASEGHGGERLVGTWPPQWGTRWQGEGLAQWLRG
ncbi:hypothetical protein H1C71_014868 [Ictidomys tridecemlineatus]|nr:hypothetical protein H1C71_014868 [Ictidomys tridecemlineatus]